MQREPSKIAVVGVSALFPGSSDVTGFWHDVLAGQDRLGPVPPSHWLVADHYDPDPSAPDKIYVDRGGFLDPIEFDPMAWGIPPSVVPSTDSTQLLALVVAQRVLEDAWQSQFANVDRERMSVILGVTSAQKLLGEMSSRLQRPVWIKALREMGLPESQVQDAAARIAAHYVPWQETTFPGVLGNVVAGRIANRLDLGGTNCVIDAACASSLSALSMAIDELSLGHSDVVIAGGADTMNDPFMFTCFAKTTALSKSGDCRPFDAKADGTMLGEGVGMIALARLEDAVARGDRVYAIIRAIGASSDGRAKSVYAPLPAGQARAIRRAYERAGFDPRTVELIEAHGTGTAAGDAAEVEGLKQVFGEHAEQPWCAIGSVKSQIGHTKAAAGAAGLIKTILALRHGVIPPTIKIDAPAPALAGSPFYPSIEARPWIRGGDHPRRAGVSAFGFGGSNFHVALEEHTGAGRAPRLPFPTEQLVVLSGSASEVSTRIRDTLATLGTPGLLARLAWESQRAFDASAPLRVAIVAADDADLRAKLELALPFANEAFIEKGEAFAAPGGVYLGAGHHEGKIAFVFPGQGSQYVGMGAGLAMRFERARAVWDRAAEARVHEHVFALPAFGEDEKRDQQERLTRTENAQPALGLMSASMLEVLRALGVTPSMAVGHSFGEVSALSCAGALDEAAMLAVARERGARMAEAAREDGAMLAVSASREAVERWLAQARGEPGELALVIANHNHPEQVVLSGRSAAIDEAQSKLREAGMRASRLDVATAFHSPIVAAAAEPFARALDGVAFGPLALDVYANATAAPYTSATAKAILSSQIAEPVRFVECVEAMHAAGARTFVEVGARSVLTGLVGRTLRGRAHRAIALDRQGAGLRAFWLGLAQLAAAGVPLRFDALWEDEREPVDPRASARPKLTLPISGANYGKPFPAEAPAPNPEPAPRDPIASAAPAPLPNVPNVPAASEPMSVPSSTDPAWIAALLETQRQTAEAHAAYTRAMADAHTAFLRASEVALTQLASLAVAPGAVPHTQPSLPHARQVSSQPPVIAPPAAPYPVPTAPSSRAPIAGSARLDPTATLLSVVALKTGYPEEMLSPSMELEADLGVDSIKRVEILAALKERMPSLPDLDPAALGKLRTLSEIASLLGGASPATAPPAPAVIIAEPTDPTPLLLEVVAQKTGYPVEMLSPSMELEADLGVDSIKRVEILAALKERMPSLPDLDPAALGKLRTLSEIAALLGGTSPAAAVSPAAAAAPAPAAIVADRTDPMPLLLEVVAQKTGYPVEMLSPSMELEADLGVDSIKRVEILAALKERMPSLPDLDPAALGKLRTLAEIASLLARPASEVATVSGALAPAPSGGAKREARSVERARVVLMPSPRPGLPAPGLRGRFVVTEDGSGVAAALVERLRGQGVRAEIGAPDASADAVIILGGLRDTGGPADERAVLREAFDAARTFAPRAIERGGLFVLVQGTGGTLGLSACERPCIAALAGLAKTAALEWPKACVRAIDLARAPSAERLADRLLLELTEGGTDLEVAIDPDGMRRAPSVEALSATVEVALSGPPVVVASGGARGVTARCLIELAKRRAGRYLLLGRSELDDALPEVDGPDLERALIAGGIAIREARARAERIRASREARATMDALRSHGAAVAYASVDVRDARALDRELRAARDRFGPFTMLVHGAGVLADRRLEAKRDEDFARVVETKLDGLTSLLDAAACDPLSSIVLFSSVAARYGNAGQADYAMANAALGAIAAREAVRRPDARVVAIEWGPWKGGMVGPELEKIFAARGVPLIDLDEGAAIFVEEALADPGREPIVVVGASLVADKPKVARFEPCVARATHGYLLDHTVEDAPVLPMVLAIEWMARAARSLLPELYLARVRDVSVLRGVRLDALDEGERFELTLERIGNGLGATYAAELASARGKHYRAELDLVPERPNGAPPRPAPAGLAPWTGATYGGALFHGPRFQVIRKIDGVGEAGAAALLVGTRAAGWPEERWALDPALLDGALQLAVLWAERRLGGASLPTGLEALHLHRDGPIEGEVRAYVYGHGASSGRGVCDVVLVERASGRAIAELRGLSVHVRPSTLARAHR